MPDAEEIVTPWTVNAPQREGERCRVRMYRQGLGDCFLLTLFGEAGKPFYVMIDCGVILGTPGAADTMKQVVQHIKETTSHIDVLVVTHEHWDHLSGFIQARDVFKTLTFGAVWLAWTEDPKDDLANKLRAEHTAMRVALAEAAMRCEMAGDADSAGELGGLLGFFGAAGQGTTTAALEFVKGLVEAPVFCHPSDEPREFEGTKTRVFVLGPPHDEAMIKRFNPSKKAPETFGMLGSSGLRFATDGFVDGLLPLDAFDPQYCIPLHVAQQVPFFSSRYWGEDADASYPAKTGDESKYLQSTSDQAWRRIDADWLGSGTELALKLDSATNNTSLALAFELPGGDVLLFAADAQVGNWLSWQTLSWQTGETTTTGPDLLGRTVLYKAGHHGSHNATLKALGLEEMTRLKMVLVPVDHEMAVKKRWGNIPLPELLTALETAAGGFVLRCDADVPAAVAGQVLADALFFEVSL